MVTKAARFQSRRTSTPGKVFTSDDLLEGELGLNLADRKLYSKDANGTVFQVAGEAGRDAGDYAQWDNFLGSGLQGLGIKDGGRIWFRRDNDTENDYTNVWITRSPRAFSGPLTGTASALRVQTTVDQTTKQFEWNLTSILEVNAPNGGEHCATYSQAVKKADGTAWALCLENRDFVPSPQTGTVTQECGLFVKGDDPLRRRIALHVSLNAADNKPIIETGVINKIGTAVSIGGPSTHVRMGDMISLQGDAECLINMTETDLGYHDLAIAFANNHRMVWRDPPTDGTAGNTSATVRGGIAWLSSIDTFQFSGIPVTAGAASAPDRKAKVNINGVNYYINLTPA